MDGYAESMLYDDMSTKKEINMQCPSCQLELTLKVTDEFVKCKRCGEMFYLEDMEDNE